MNNIILSGEASVPKFSHVSHGKKIYEFAIESQRESGIIDTLPCMIAEGIVNEIYDNQFVKITGEIRTKNFDVDGKRKLVIYVWIKGVLEYTGIDENFLILNGTLCKDPVLRKTPRGKEISDMIVGRSDDYKRTAYIPCIAWNKEARYVSKFGVGASVSIQGRLQSRIYEKFLDDGMRELRTAYEVSVNDIQIDKGGK